MDDNYDSKTDASIPFGLSSGDGPGLIGASYHILDIIAG
jgi:hypothetical protein